ncbi:MAG: NAD(P)-binding domain-containing protein [Anaerolineales bacterium]
MSETTDVVVVGAGQAGLVVSYLLSQANIPHLVLERGEIGESWRSQRWDSFCLNTPNWSIGLAGMEFQPEVPDGFGNRDQLIAYFVRYAGTHDLPIRPHSNVTALDNLSAGGYALQTQAGTLNATAVVLATGALSRPRVPAMARRLSADITSLSAGAYKNPGSLPEGAVVVVGSGQSGCQIVEDLLSAGRQVYLCASKVGRVPRTYRGRDVVDWMRDTGFFDVKVDELEDPALQFAAQPQVSGTDGGHTVSLQSLARDGATLLGRVLEVDGDLLRLDDNLQECIDFADEKSQAFKTAVDIFIDQNGIQAEAAQPDPGEPALADPGGSGHIDTLDLRCAGVASVIWCTGYDADWSWVRVDVFDEKARPRHRAGITESPGLYFIGFPWLTKRKSGILYGVSEDAANMVQHIKGFLLGAVG